jgi:hypothetical protein
MGTAVASGFAAVAPDLAGGAIGAAIGYSRFGTFEGALYYGQLGMFAGNIAATAATIRPGGALNEAIFGWRLRRLERRNGTANVHSVRDHGKHAGYDLQLRRIRTGQRPSGGYGPIPPRASQFFTNRDHFLLMRRAVQLQRQVLQAGGTSAQQAVGLPRIIGMGIERADESVFWASDAVFNFDRLDRSKLFTGFPSP